MLVFLMLSDMSFTIFSFFFLNTVLIGLFTLFYLWYLMHFSASPNVLLILSSLSLISIFFNSSVLIDSFF